MVDLMASDVPALLRSLEGRGVVTSEGVVVLHPRGQRLVRVPVPLRIQGAGGSVPAGSGRPWPWRRGSSPCSWSSPPPEGSSSAPQGCCCFWWPPTGLKVLPVNLAGAALLVGGLGILVGDLLVGGTGMLSLLGTGALALGALFLFRAPGGGTPAGARVLPLSGPGGAGGVLRPGPAGGLAGPSSGSLFGGGGHGGNPRPGGGGPEPGGDGASPGGTLEGPVTGRRGRPRGGDGSGAGGSGGSCWKWSPGTESWRRERRKTH